jgi:hypothetical protein
VQIHPGVAYPAMATIGLVPSSVVASTAIRAPAPASLTRASNRQLPHARRLLDLGRRAPAMDALRVSGAAEPLLRPAAAGGHPRLRVRLPTDPPVPPRLNIALAHPCYSGGGTRRLSLVVKGLTRWRMCRCGPVRSRAKAAPRRRGTPRSRGRPSSSRKLLPGHPLGFCTVKSGVELGFVSTPFNPPQHLIVCRMLSNSVTDAL